MPSKIISALYVKKLDYSHSQYFYIFVLGPSGPSKEELFQYKQKNWANLHKSQKRFILYLSIKHNVFEPSQFFLHRIEVVEWAKIERSC